MKCDGVRIQQLPTIHLVAHGGKRAGQNTRENITRTGSCQRSRTRERQQHTLNATDSRRRPLGNDHQIVGACSPDNLLRGRNRGTKVVHLVTGNQTRKLTIVRRHNQRLFATIHLGITINTVNGNLSKAVECIGVQDKRHIKLEQARNHLHSAGRRRHTGTAQYTAVLLCNLAHSHARSGAKGAAGIRRNSKDGNRRKCHANKIGAGVRSRDCHVTSTRASCRLGRHNGSTRILRRSGDNKHRATGILIDIRR